MMTSRAEYRLLLRQDNADLRLRKKGYEAGLISEGRYSYTKIKQQIIESETARLKESCVGASKNICEFLNAAGSADVVKSTSLAELICRPELDYEKIEGIDAGRKEAYEEYDRLINEELARSDDRNDTGSADILTPENTDKFFAEVKEQINIEVKYDGYILRQKKQVEHFKKMETRRIPADMDYDSVGSLRLEARQKLKEIRPENLGQASRIGGVSPADVNVLLIYLEGKRT